MFSPLFMARAAKRYLDLMKLNCQSQTLRDSMVVTILELPDGFQVNVYMPQYWAKYYHDGRRAFRAKEGRALAFWPSNPLQNDPRLSGGYPISRSEIKHLTKDEFYQHLGKGDMVAIHSDDGGVAAAEGKRFSEPTFREFSAWLSVNLPAEFLKQSEEALDPLRDIKQL